MPLGMEDLVFMKEVFEKLIPLYKDIFLTLIKKKREEKDWSGMRIIDILEKKKCKETYVKEHRIMTIEKMEKEIKEGTQRDRKLMFFLIKDLCEFKEEEYLEKIYDLEKVFNHSFVGKLEDSKDEIIKSVDKCYNALKDESGQDFSVKKEKLINEISGLYEKSHELMFSEHCKEIAKEIDCNLSSLNKNLEDLLRRRQPHKHDMHDIGKYLEDVKVKKCTNCFRILGNGVIKEEKGSYNLKNIIELFKEETKDVELFIVYSSTRKHLETIGKFLVAKLMEGSHIVHIKSSEVKEDNCSFKKFFEGDKELQKLSEKDVGCLQTSHVDIFFVFDFFGNLEKYLYNLLKDVTRAFHHRKHIVITDEENVHKICHFIEVQGIALIKLFKVSE